LHRRKDFTCSHGEQPRAKLEHNSQHGTLTIAEVDALYSGLLAARRKEFDDEVMRELLTDEAELSYSTAKAPKKRIASYKNITVTV